MPQVTAGAGIIATPRVIAITYDNDPNRSALEAFFTQYAASTAWPAQVSEYGVGALTIRTPQHIAGNAPATIATTDLLDLPSQNTTGASPAWGAADPNTIYEFSIPEGGSFSDPGFGTCCIDYLGFHEFATIGTIVVPYAVLCACAAPVHGLGRGLSARQDLTEIANHETIEASADPTGAGFNHPDGAHFAWSYPLGGELGDMCERSDTAYDLQPDGIDDTISRSWSNAATKASHDPCVPGANATYYQTIPDAPDAQTIAINGAAVATNVTKIGLNVDGTLTLHVHADAAGAVLLRLDRAMSALMLRTAR